MNNIRVWLLDHFAQEVDISWLSRQYGMSRRSFYRAWHKISPASPVAFLLELRLGYAARLLRESELSIQKTAFESGFRSIPYFGKCFRRRFGISPTDFRNQERKKLSQEKSSQNASPAS